MSNRLPILQGEARTSHEAAAGHIQSAAERAIAAGALLAEAKALCVHGDWGPWLTGTAIPERTAQRYIALHRGGHKPATLADLGFARAEQLSLAGLKMWPKVGRAVVAYGWDEDANPFQFAAVWHEDSPGACHYCSATLTPFEPISFATRHPVPPWMLGALHGREAKRFDRYDEQDMPFAEAADLVMEIRMAAGETGHQR